MNSHGLVRHYQLRIQTTLFLACLLPLLHAAQAAQLPCDSPVTPLEKMVCSDKEARSLDGLVHRLYEDALHSSGGALDVIERHRLWTIEKRDLCHTLTCVKEAYYLRLEELDGFARRLSKQGVEGASNFQGSWQRVNPSGFEPSLLIIERETLKGFSFSISAENGVRSGTFHGDASRLSPEIAKYDGDISCQLEFRRAGAHELSLIESGCNDIGGVGVTFGGRYVRDGTKQEQSVRDFINVPKVNELFRELVGDYYPLFLSTAHLSSSLPVRDALRVTANSFVVRGLSTVRESILMIGTEGELWAAVIQPVDGENLTPKVLYFTNQPEWRERVPDTIHEWRKGFSTYPLIYIDVQKQ